MKILNLLKLFCNFLLLTLLVLFAVIPVPVRSANDDSVDKVDVGLGDVANPDDNPYTGTIFTDPKGDPNDRANGDDDIANTGGIGERTKIPTPPPKWPGATLIFAYDSQGPQFSAEQKALIKAIQDTITKKTSGCIKFRPKTAADPHFAVFTKRGPTQGCEALIGYVSDLAPRYRIDGGQYINLNDQCFSQPENLVPAHEMFHALGIFHEMRRPDRDSYVKVYTDRILSANTRSFDK